ncbi:catechol O-methyltransferase-like [Gastrophryne carolinensis]
MANYLKEHRMLKFALENSVRGNPKSVLDHIDNYCRNKEWAVNVGDEKGLILDNVVQETNPSLALELGTYCGYSAIRIARLLKDGAQLYTIEMNPAHVDVARQMIQFAGIQDKVKILQGSTEQIIPRLKAEHNMDSAMAESKERRILEFVQQNAVRGDPQSVVDTIDKYCSQKEWAMNVGDEKGLILDNLVKEADPCTALELGTYCGYSAVRIARLLKPQARLFTIEMNPAHADVAKQMIEFAGVQDKVKILQGSSENIIPALKAGQAIEHLDFVFIDHFGNRYTADTKLLESCGLLKKGSVLVADNVVYPGAPDFLQYVRTSGHYDCTNYPSHVEYTDKPDALEKAVFIG